MDKAALRPVGLMLLALSGCTQIDSQGRVEEAMDLAGQRIGHRPEWSVPWDSDPPTWDAQSVLTLDQAVVIALRNNRALRADLETIGQANADLVQAGLMANPTINFMLMFPSGGGRTMLRGNGLPMQPLQDLWLIPARQEVARTELQQAVLRVADRAVETAAEVKRVYARLQYAARALELIRDNTRVVDQSTQIIGVRQTAGQATQVDVNLSRIRLLRLQSDLINMEAEYRAGQRELLMLMGLPGAGDAWQVTPLHEMQETAEAPPEELRLLALAADQRLDLKAADWTLQSARHRVELMKREGWPEIAVGFSFERSPAPQSNNPTWAGRAGNAAVRGLVDRASGMQSGPMLPEAFSPKMREVEYTLGPMFEMEIPLFDRGQAQVARAIHEYRQRAAEYDDRAQRIVRDVRAGLVRYRQAYDQVRFYRSSVLPEVERNLVLAQQSFTAGQQGLTVYLQVQEDLIMARLRVLEFVRDLRLAAADLERQAGGRLTADVPTTQPATSASP